MPKVYDDVDAKCPYFLGSDKHKIVCEGVTDGSRTVLEFDTKKLRNTHRELFCNSRYQNCEVCRMLEDKYDGME